MSLTVAIPMRLTRCSKAATDGARFCRVDAWEPAPSSIRLVTRDANYRVPIAIMRKRIWRFA